MSGNVSNAMDIMGDNLRSQGVEPGAMCCATMSVSAVSMVALFVLGCLGAAGVMSAGTLGWCAVGLGAGGFLISLPSLRGKTLVKTLVVGGLVAAAIVTVGALGIAGVLSAQVIGWAILGSFLGQMVLGTCIACCDPATLRNIRETRENVTRIQQELNQNPAYQSTFF